MASERAKVASQRVVVTGARSFLAHTPGLVRHGSKTTREIETDPSLEHRIAGHLRTYEQAASYLPNRAYLDAGALDELGTTDRPWYNRDGEVRRRLPYGEIMPEEEFYGLLKVMDGFDLVWLEEGFAGRVREQLLDHPYWHETDLTNLAGGVSAAQIEQQLAPDSGALPLHLRDGTLAGVITRAHDKDAALFADVLLENLACKAAGVMAAKTLLDDTGIPPDSVQYVLNTGEEAVGDRYQRGGGNLAKAMAEVCGCTNATGSDVKAFCCGPNHAAVMAGALVASGVFERVMVVGGCSLAKLGMKHAGHMRNDMPILEDVLAGVAFMLEKDDGRSPVLRLDSVGTHPVGAGGAQEAILSHLVVKPLERLGLTFSDIDKYATEMHNPEVTEPAGSGNVPALNYKLIAALAARAGHIDRSEMDGFVATHGMPGFSPTQGHIASAIPFLPHAVDGITEGEMKRVMFLAKGSLFLGRMTQMSDGISFMIEGNDGRGD